MKDALVFIAVGTAKLVAVSVLVTTALAIALWED